MSQATAVSVRILDGFDDPAIDAHAWRRLQRSGPMDEVFLTHWWQKTWWDIFGRGQLLMIGVYHNESLIGLAPLFADGGMIFLIGSGGSDYLDFVGDVSTHDVLSDLLTAAAEAVPDFVGFRFYHVPDDSATGPALQRAARKLGYACHDEGDSSAPMVDLRITGDQVARKKSLLRHQRYFEREGKLSVQHSTSGPDIRPRLEDFFEQHIERWDTTPYPSLFLDVNQRRFYQALTESVGSESWLRFTEVRWNDIPIAFHFGFHYAEKYLWYKPTFAIEFARHSPGEVLLRSLLLAALHEGANVFDFGLGSEAFKSRFATHTRSVRNWGLYPPEILNPHSSSGAR